MGAKTPKPRRYLHHLFLKMM
uniref:Uncharacterized protein n=1 Tax=Anguilla anguilla TaxID=7936 RepID=A0A0E9UIH3_ANGAN